MAQFVIVDAPSTIYGLIEYIDGFCICVMYSCNSYDIHTSEFYNIKVSKGCCDE